LFLEVIQEQVIPSKEPLQLLGSHASLQLLDLLDHVIQSGVKVIYSESQGEVFENDITRRDCVDPIKETEIEDGKQTWDWICTLFVDKEKTGNQVIREKESQVKHPGHQVAYLHSQK